jgi:hypothetical protein
MAEGWGTYREEPKVVAHRLFQTFLTGCNPAVGDAGLGSIRALAQPIKLCVCPKVRGSDG